jgi:hypothetical protein
MISLPPIRCELSFRLFTTLIARSVQIAAVVAEDSKQSAGSQLWVRDLPICSSLTCVVLQVMPCLRQELLARHFAPERTFDPVRLRRAIAADGTSKEGRLQLLHLMRVRVSCAQRAGLTLDHLNSCLAAVFTDHLYVLLCCSALLAERMLCCCSKSKCLTKPRFEVVKDVAVKSVLVSSCNHCKWKAVVLS